MMVLPTLLPTPLLTILLQRQTSLYIITYSRNYRRRWIQLILHLMKSFLLRFKPNPTQPQVLQDAHTHNLSSAQTVYYVACTRVCVCFGKSKNVLSGGPPNGFSHYQRSLLNRLYRNYDPYH
jgi:hypothetical protein